MNTFRGLIVVVVMLAAHPALAQEAIVLRENIDAGYQYHVSCRVQLSGKLALPPDKGKTAPQTIDVNGQSAIEYDERILALDKDRNVSKTIRHYGRMDFDRKVGDQVQANSLRQEASKLVLIRFKQMEVPFSPIGPLTWGEIDMVRTDVFTPALAGLLPDKSVRVGDRWPASRASVQELTDLDRVQDGSLECRLESISALGKRQHARISFSGTIRGLGEDGPARHQLDGFVLFDMESNHLGYLSMKGIHFMLDKDGKDAGKVEGTFVLTRQPRNRIETLADDALRGLTLEPNDDNTLLLFDNPDFGLRFLYPRRWRVAGSKGQQLGIDESNGSGLLLTVETLKRLPTAAQYLEESRNWLTQQKVKILRSDSPRVLSAAPNHLENFGFDAIVEKQNVRLEYFVLRQAQGGVTIAARLLTRDLADLQRDVQRIARSMQVTRPQ
ncbi:MAG: hypothetical protein FJ271_25400 [Planctomycetes bacterium]|nr:hypothetical protein [Planctomycetota bacterium]